MASFPREALQEILESVAYQVIPDYIKLFWDPVVEGYTVTAVIDANDPLCLTYNLSISSGRIYLSPKAGAPC